MSTKQEQEEIKQIIATGLDFLASVCTVASGINPLFEIAGKLLRMGSNVLKGDEMKEMENKFKAIDSNLQNVSQIVSELCSVIQEGEAKAMLSRIEGQIKRQFRALVEVVECKKKIEHFHSECFSTNTYKNIDDLYCSVMGEETLFGQSILSIYKDKYKSDKNSMKELCDHLKYLFVIGIITYLEYVESKSGGDPEPREEWKAKVNKVWKRMEEAIEECN
ncbi:uncharacterized protein LOC122793759 [Protopterus annectens]|uniref:uncharacterized protein LOC122793759 n=1 Tax=Protopterus annectens TaxID=7888 RepID=UPI001CFB10DE|nr:uncharacterized protein LOC122793759 [Protopterus annectens]